MADVVLTLERGGQRFAEKYLEWNRKTIRKGMQERENGQPIEDCFHNRGRKKVEEHPPSLLENIREIVEPRSQTDPTFRSSRVYRPLTAEEVRHRLRTQFGYSEAQLPCVRTLELHTLVSNADKGTESDGHRTQWLKRLVALSDAHQLTIQLA